MTPAAFTAWLTDMKDASIITTKQDAAALLDVTDDTVTNYLKRGAPRYIALACRALLHRMEPYA